MPPEDEPQPSAEERARAIADLTRLLTTAWAELNTSGGHSVLRRLNSWEYRQTIGDLLGLNVDVWNPAEDFPDEVTVDGFNNNGTGLVTSGRLLDHDFAAAEEAIRRATQFGPRPASKEYVQRSPFYFDAVGGWRDEYEGKIPIDSAGKLPGGDTFQTVLELRKLFVDRRA